MFAKTRTFVFSGILDGINLRILWFLTLLISEMLWWGQKALGLLWSWEVGRRSEEAEWEGQDLTTRTEGSGCQSWLWHQLSDRGQITQLPYRSCSYLQSGENLSLKGWREDSLRSRVFDAKNRIFFFFFPSLRLTAGPPPVSRLLSICAAANKVLNHVPGVWQEAASLFLSFCLLFVKDSEKLTYNFKTQTYAILTVSKLWTTPFQKWRSRSLTDAALTPWEPTPTAVPVGCSPFLSCYSYPVVLDDTPRDQESCHRRRGVRGV